MLRDAANFLALATDTDATKYVVAYAKVVDDKDDGVYMTDVYFGGVGNTHQEAEQIAREVVNTTRGGTVLARIVPTCGAHNVLAALDRASKRFGQMEVQMFEAEDIINRNQARAKARA